MLYCIKLMVIHYANLMQILNIHVPLKWAKWNAFFEIQIS